MGECHNSTRTAEPAADTQQKDGRRLRRFFLVNALLDAARQFLVACRNDAHHPLDFRVIRACCSHQDFLGAGS